MAERSDNGQFLVECARCGQTDDHPMHHMGAEAGGRKVSFHTDCHAILGCPICLEVRKDVTSEKGADLQAVLTAQEPLTQDRVAELLGQG